MQKKRLWGIFLAAALLLSSCGSGGTTLNISASNPGDTILSVLLHSPYLNAAGISVNHKSDRDKMPDKIASALKGEPVIIKLEDGGLFGKDYYAVTSKGNGICYYGKVSGNRPDGFGVISYGQIDLNNLATVKNIRYAGNFKDGLYSGYGVEFGAESQSYVISRLIEEGLLDQQYEAIAEVYFSAYVTYDGDWKKGEKTGKGNLFSLNNFQYNTVQDGYWGSVCYPYIVVSDVKDGMADGSTKTYSSGVLTFDGQTKDNTKHGKGTTYYMNGQKEYDGEWKYGLRSGTGKLYDESGSLIYSGKWEKGDYKS